VPEMSKNRTRDLSARARLICSDDEIRIDAHDL